MNKETKCYVYGHYFKENDKLFYIGKGTGKRMLSPNRSKDWKAITENNLWYAKVIADNLSTKDALDLELKLIKSNTGLINKVKNSETKEMDNNFLSMFYYDETSPSCLRYAKSSIGVNGRIYKQVGDVAGIVKVEPSRKKKRYTVQVDAKLYYVHRVIFALFNEIVYDTVVDHIDGDSTNNKISNLRQVPQKLNGRNISKCKSSTDVMGVSLVKRNRLNFQQYVASFYDLSGTLKQKEFGCYKYGKEEAFRLACEWRKERIKELNEQGAGYTDRHGT